MYPTCRKDEDCITENARCVKGFVSKANFYECIAPELIPLEGQDRLGCICDSWFGWEGYNCTETSALTHSFVTSDFVLVSFAALLAIVAALNLFSLIAWEIHSRRQRKHLTSSFKTSSKRTLELTPSMTLSMNSPRPSMASSRASGFDEETTQGDDDDSAADVGIPRTFMEEFPSEKTLLTTMTAEMSPGEGEDFNVEAAIDDDTSHMKVTPSDKMLLKRATTAETTPGGEQGDDRDLEAAVVDDNTRPPHAEQLPSDKSLATTTTAQTTMSAMEEEPAIPWDAFAKEEKRKLVASKKSFSCDLMPLSLVFLFVACLGFVGWMCVDAYRMLSVKSELQGLDRNAVGFTLNGIFVALVGIYIMKLTLMVSFLTLTATYSSRFFNMPGIRMTWLIIMELGLLAALIWSIQSTNFAYAAFVGGAFSALAATFTLLTTIRLQGRFHFQPRLARARQRMAYTERNDDDDDNIVAKETGFWAWWSWGCRWKMTSWRRLILMSFVQTFLLSAVVVSLTTVGVYESYDLVATNTLRGRFYQVAEIVFRYAVLCILILYTAFLHDSLNRRWQVTRRSDLASETLRKTLEEFDNRERSDSAM